LTRELPTKAREQQSGDPPSEGTAGATAQPSRLRGLLATFIKVVVAAVLLGWLVRSGRFKLNDTLTLVNDPALLLAGLSAWAVSGVLIATLRFRTLLRTIDIRLPLARGLALQLIALFFNVIVPGNVGGDVMKAIDVARGEPAERRTQVYLLVFMERIFGLMGLALLALVAIIARAPFLLNSAQLRPTAIAGAAIAFGIASAPVAASWVLLRARRLVLRVVGRVPALQRLALKLMDGLDLVTKSRAILLQTIVLSMANHAFPMLFFFFATRRIVAPSVDLGTIASIFPLGILTLVLPISPGGLGVGHVAFDSLFNAVGLRGGALVFNVFLLSQALPCVIGVIPYLLLRRRKPTLS
jgi:glycosyltransferase 2 family protein